MTSEHTPWASPICPAQSCAMPLRTFRILSFRRRGQPSNFIEEPSHRRVAPRFRRPTIRFLNERAELNGLDVGEPFVLERDVRQALHTRAELNPLGAELMHVGGLARPTHTIDSSGLAGKTVRARNPSRRERREGRCRRVGQEFAHEMPEERLGDHWNPTILLIKRINFDRGRNMEDSADPSAVFRRWTPCLIVRSPSSPPAIKVGL